MRSNFIRKINGGTHEQRFVFAGWWRHGVVGSSVCMCEHIYVYSRTPNKAMYFGLSADARTPTWSHTPRTHTRSLQNLEEFLQFHHQRPVGLQQVVAEVVLAGVDALACDLETEKGTTLSISIWAVHIFDWIWTRMSFQWICRPMSRFLSRYDSI